MIFNPRPCEGLPSRASVVIRWAWRTPSGRTRQAPPVPDQRRPDKRQTPPYRHCASPNMPRNQLAAKCERGNRLGPSKTNPIPSTERAHWGWGWGWRHGQGCVAPTAKRVALTTQRFSDSHTCTPGARAARQRTQKTSVKRVRPGPQRMHRHSRPIYAGLKTSAQGRGQTQRLLVARCVHQLIPRQRRLGGQQGLAALFAGRAGAPTVVQHRLRQAVNQGV